ncbi:hypothetical protein [Pseudomonas cavernae]|uniref:hypothetical protein n=1 Tax=Pseudomonas cavernae TaxID=2320867 RepID=UPI0013C514EC|nr:hypothetical protein [Pseudomonas cavernae]
MCLIERKAARLGRVSKKIALVTFTRKAPVRESGWPTNPITFGTQRTAEDWVLRHVIHMCRRQRHERAMRRHFPAKATCFVDLPLTAA